MGMVVIPTNRPPDQTFRAIRRAVRQTMLFRSAVIVLASQKADPAEIAKRVGQRYMRRVVVVDMAFAKHYLPDLLPRLETDKNSLAYSLPETWDTSEKRNLGLLLAAVLGHQTLLFLDDDLLGRWGRLLSSVRLAAAATAVRSGVVDAGGWILDRFPDNSVVCHARRLAGLPQGIFVGAAALLVRVEPQMPFFPRVYNEDWLFQYPLMERRSDGRGGLAVFGKVCQRSYDPYAKGRASREEVGDVLAEGMYQLLSEAPERAREASVQSAFWEEACRQRAEMIRLVSSRLLPSDQDNEWVQRQRRAATAVKNVVPVSAQPVLRWPWRRWQTVHDAVDRQRARTAMKAALDEHRLRGDVPLPRALAAWVEGWRRDLGRWQHHLAEAPAAVVDKLLGDEAATPVVGPSAARAMGLQARGAVPVRR